MNNRFIKPPLSKIEKEKKAEDFLNFSTEKDTQKRGQEIKNLNECLVTNFKTRFLICWLAFIIVEGGQVIEFVTLNHLITKNDDNQPIWSINIKMAGCERSLLEPFQTLSLV